MYVTAINLQEELVLVIFANPEVTGWQDSAGSTLTCGGFKTRKSKNIRINITLILFDLFLSFDFPAE